MNLTNAIVINGWLMQATLGILRTESPELCQVFRSTKAASRGSEGSLLATYELALSHHEAAAIHSTLEHARIKFGDERLFEGMPLHSMSGMWRRYVEQLDEGFGGGR
jgi:hypothetical protein